ncbi:MAG: adenylate/guanylate cyclase domain-containing protein [Spirochaetes bacterium]|nr:adenylate/guanylate cyclase domain-containing protein [Spirochaetota bacterium]
MNSEFFRKTNRKSVFFLMIILMLVIVNGIISLCLHDVFMDKTDFYIETLSAAKTIEIKLQKQIKFTKDILLSRNDIKKNYDYYYRYSQAYNEIQNDFFNFHYSFIDKEIKFKIEDLTQAHKKLSKDYLNFLFTEQDETSTDTAEALNENEQQVIKLMDDISFEIDSRINSELDRLNDNYIISLLLLMTTQIIFTVILLGTINRNSRRAQTEMVELSRRLNSYLPPQLIHSILYGNYCNDSILLKKDVTVCFTDLQGFTEIAGRTDPDTMSKILNEYLIDMSTIVHAWGGMIDKFMGDGIMILFNAFEKDSDVEHAYLCVNMALAMQHHMKILNARWKSNGIDVSLTLRIGINSGETVLGNFGPADRKTFTAVGNTVNVASRLEAICPAGEVLVSNGTKDQIENRFVFIETGKKIIKGFSLPQETFIVKELIG